MKECHYNLPRVSTYTHLFLALKLKQTAHLFIQEVERLRTEFFNDDNEKKKTLKMSKAFIYSKII